MNMSSRLLVALLFGIGVCSLAHAETLYLSPEGRDTWSGRLRSPNKAHTDGPLATLEAARDAIRAAKKKAGLPKGGFAVELAGGTYWRTQPFALTAEDSGTAAAPIVYRAHARETVRIMGGKPVTLWKPVSDSTVLARLPEAARGKVWQADLAASGFGTLPGVQVNGSWGQSTPGAELFFADKVMTLARYPNTGTLTIADVVNGKVVDGQGIKESKTGQIIYSGEEPSRWVGEPDAWLHGFWGFDWADQRQKIAAIDPAKHMITLAKPDHEFGYRTNQWYYAFNLLSELDAPGEWYLDHASNIVYFYPPMPLKEGDAIVSTVPTLVTMKDTSYVTLQGLTLEVAQDSAVTIQGGSDDAVADCRIRNVAAWGVRITEAVRSGVSGCEISETGDGGIDLIGGDRKTLTPGNLYARNNYVHDYSRWNPVYQAGVRTSGVGSQIQHNLIANAPHEAIAFGGNDHLIEYNEIHDVVRESNDAGAIYAGRDWSMRGNVIRANYLHHIQGRGNRGAVGVYLDDDFSSATITGNVFYEVTRAAFIGGGRDNFVTNNLFIDCKPAVWVDARGIGWAAKSQELLTQRLRDMPFEQEPWRSRYPQLLTLLGDDPMAPKGSRIECNVRIGGTWADIENSALPYITVANNVTEGDPLLVDPAKGKLDFAKQSPVWKTGFQPIPWDKIGLEGTMRKKVGGPVLPVPAKAAVAEHK